MIRMVITLLFAIGISTIGNSQIIKDETYLDKDFWTFRAKLEEAIINKSTTKLKKLLADKVRESNDGCGASGCDKDEFIEYYFGDGSVDETWEEIKTVVRFGFIRRIDEYTEMPVKHDKTVFQAPSYLSEIDEDNEIIVLGEKVNIREQPSLNAKVIKQASYEVFKCDCNILTSKETTYQTKEGIGWLEIYLENNKIGYIAAKYTSYEIIKEMTVGKINGKWKIISYYHSPGC